MAFKKTYNKKKPFRKRNYKRRNYKSSIPRTHPKLKQRIIGFKRNFSLPVIALEDPSTWNTPAMTLVRGAVGNRSVLGTMVFSLSMLPGYSEFKNLFNQYKLNAVVMKIYPTTSTVVTQNINGPVPAGAIGSTNFTITTWRNQTGQPYPSGVFTDALEEQIVAKKTRMFPKNKPYVISCKLNQLSATYNQQQAQVEVTTTAGTNVNVLQPYNVDYGVRKPRYINTVEDSTPHYGLNIRFRKLDDSDFGTLSPRLKIYYTLYFSCKGIQ